MQLNINLTSGQDLILPIHYNHILQQFIYHSIDKTLANFLHDKGFIINNRSLKLFVFSRIIGSYQIDKTNNTINFGKNFKVCIASPLIDFCQSFCECIMSSNNLQLGNTLIQEVQVDIIDTNVDKSTITIRTQSPITVYSTLMRPEGKKFTCYFQPGEADFERLVASNLKNKYEAFIGTPPSEDHFGIKAISRPKMNIIKYKSTVIKGYSGLFRLQGPLDLLKLALDCGLGSKNAQGFGYCQLKERK